MNSKLELNLFYYNYLNKINNLFIYNVLIPNQKPEKESGNREYKISLNYEFCNKNRQTHILDKKSTQMVFRLNEGRGKAVYIIGIKDDGTTQGIPYFELVKSLFFFEIICNNVDAKFNNIRIYNGKDGFLATIRVYKPFSNLHLLLDI